jgi:hypothetical protein
MGYMFVTKMRTSCKLNMYSKWMGTCIVMTYEIRVFFEGAQKEVFSSILKIENVNTLNT